MQIAHALTTQALTEARDHGFGHPRPFVDQTRIYLEERRASGKFLPGVRSVEDAANADKRQLT